MRVKIEGLSEHDRLLEDELNKCMDADRCYQIAKEAENEMLIMEANHKCIRLYHLDEYMAGSL